MGYILKLKWAYWALLKILSGLVGKILLGFLGPVENKMGLVENKMDLANLLGKLVKFQSFKPMKWNKKVLVH